MCIWLPRILSLRYCLSGCEKLIRVHQVEVPIDNNEHLTGLPVLNFQFVEMQTLKTQMNVNDILRTKGLNLDEIQKQKVNNRQLLKIKRQLKDMNIIPE